MARFRRSCSGCDSPALPGPHALLYDEEAVGSLARVGAPHWLKGQALDKLVPESFVQTIASWIKAELGPKLEWIKAQMEHARGATQSQHVSETRRAKDADAHMGAVTVDQGQGQESPVVW